MPRSLRRWSCASMRSYSLDGEVTMVVVGSTAATASAGCEAFFLARSGYSEPEERRRFGRLPVETI